MQLTDKNIQEFKKIYFEKFGEEISDQEALKQGLALVNLMKVVLNNNKKED